MSKLENNSWKNLEKEMEEIKAININTTCSHHDRPDENMEITFYTNICFFYAGTKFIRLFFVVKISPVVLVM